MMICHLGIRFNIYSDYYAQFNFHDFFSDSNYDMTILYVGLSIT